MGSNLGDRLGTLQGCVHAIGELPETDVLAVSPVYETAPVGGPAQPDYLNAVLIVATGLAPRDLLAATQRIEADFGRVRAERFGPRTLDIDLIAYDNLATTTSELTLPHPRVFCEHLAARGVPNSVGTFRLVPTDRRPPFADPARPPCRNAAAVIDTTLAVVVTDHDTDQRITRYAETITREARQWQRPA